MFKWFWTIFSLGAPEIHYAVDNIGCLCRYVKQHVHVIVQIILLSSGCSFVLLILTCVIEYTNTISFSRSLESSQERPLWDRVPKCVSWLLVVRLFSWKINSVKLILYSQLPIPVMVAKWFQKVSERIRDGTDFVIIPRRWKRRAIQASSLLPVRSSTCLRLD